MGLKEELENEARRLKMITNKLEKDLQDVPEGSLRLSKSQGYVQYYHSLPNGRKNGEYLPKSKIELIQKLAQKAYHKRVYKLSGKRLSQFERILKDYENDEIENCFLQEHPERRKLIVPVEATYEQKLEAWKDNSFVGKGFNEDAPVILTNSGLRVRSKSEKILADYFDSVGILFKYECPIHLQSYGIVYPDFTFFSRKRGQEIYWEHEGMMDLPEYARNAVRKIELYEKNGIYPGERLLLTFETSFSVINTRLIQSMTEKYLL